MEREDSKTLYASYEIDTSIGLLEKISFDIVFHFRRGREHSREMTRETFVVGADGT